MKHIPDLNERRFPETITVKVEEETKELFRAVKRKGKNAPEIFRQEGLKGLMRAWREIEHLPDRPESA